MHLSFKCQSLSCPAHGRGGDRPSRRHVSPGSAMTDGQWALLAPLLPPAGSTGGRGGRPEKWDRRLVLDAIFSLVRGGKTIKGRKRHVAVDTGGLLLAVVVTTASCRTATVRSASPPRCARRSPRSPWCGPTPGTQAGSSATRKIWDLAVAIVKRPDQAKGFVLLHRRWVVERSFAWLTKSAASYATTRPSQPPTKP